MRKTLAILPLLLACNTSYESTSHTTEAPASISEQRFETSEQISVTSNTTFDPIIFEDVYKKRSFKGLSTLLAKYSEGLDPENKARFQATLTHFENNLDDFQIVHTDQISATDTKGIQRAATSYSRDQFSKAPITIKLNTSWTPSSAMDLIHLVHEVHHADEIKKAQTSESPANWEVLHNAPANGLEIRYELEAWDLTLTLADQMADGEFSNFANEMLKPISNENADQLLDEYTRKVSNLFNLKTDQEGQIKKWLILTFLLQRSEKKDGLDCRWAYGFASEIARMYHQGGVNMYEVVNTKTGTYPNQCVYPLDEGPYLSAWIYGKTDQGLIGPKEHIDFVLTQDQ